MKETYYLNKSELPTIPVPHDCVIKEVRLDGEYLVFTFEDDISYYDSVKYHRPEAKSLIIRFHLMDDADGVCVFVRKKSIRFLHKPGAIKELDLIKANGELINLFKGKLEYLYHNVGYCSIIVKLWSESRIVLDMAVDYLEFEWICQ